MIVSCVGAGYNWRASLYFEPKYEKKGRICLSMPEPIPAQGVSLLGARLIRRFLMNALADIGDRIAKYRDAFTIEDPTGSKFSAPDAALCAFVLNMRNPRISL